MGKLHILQAAYKDNLWGGTRLKEEYGKVTDAPIVAESWELSTHPAGPAILENLGQTLPEFLEAHPEAGGPALLRYREFPILIKLIDAKSDLSVQVHPDDDYALEHENQYGKTEMWYIVDCTPDAFIYYGFKEAISPEEFAYAIENNTIEEKLRKVSVSKGDYFFIPAGTIHAIGGGCLIAEVQQSSNVTYRVYDYDRKDKDGNTRELHVAKALDVTTLEPVVSMADPTPHLSKSPYFTVDLLHVPDTCELTVTPASFGHILCVEGEVELRNGDQHLVLPQGTSVFAEADTGVVKLSGEGTILFTYLEAE